MDFQDPLIFTYTSSISCQLLFTLTYIESQSLQVPPMFTGNPATFTLVQVIRQYPVPLCPVSDDPVGPVNEDVPMVVLALVRYRDESNRHPEG